jgi:hypothetical protein
MLVGTEAGEYLRKKHRCFCRRRDMRHKDLFITSMDSRNLETRLSNNLYTPQANLSVYQKGAYYSGVKIFYKLPSNIKNVNGNITKFKITLKRFLYANSFYTLEEYFEQ